MKSRAIEIVDYHSIPLTDPIYVSGIDVQVETEKRRFMKPYKKLVEVDQIAPDDVVTLDLCSEIPKFNRLGLRLTVGKALFHRELEEKLPGIQKDEGVQLELQEGMVRVTARQILRNELPALSDQMIQEGRERLPECARDCETAEDFIKVVYDHALQQATEDAYRQEIQRILTETIAQSKWDLDEEEILQQAQVYMDMIRQQLMAQGMDMDQFTEQDWRNQFLVVKNKEEMFDYLVREYRQSTAFALLAVKLTGIEDIEAHIEEAAQQVIDKINEYVRARITVKIKEETT